MMTTFSATFPAISGKPAALVLLVCALLLPLVGRATAPAQPLPVHPQLLALVAERPDARVEVIVQKQAKDAHVEGVIPRLNGRVTQTLDMINAFTAELPAKTVPELARTEGVRWVSLDATTIDTSGGTCTACIDTARLKNAYIGTIGANRLWNQAPYLQGQGIGVAIVDSGVANHADLKGRIVVSAKLNSTTQTTVDKYGHGSHVAGIVGGNGTASNGGYIGVAPKVNLINVKVSDDRGGASVSDVVNGLQWVLDNKDTYNIRVVNLSLNNSVMDSYHNDPLSAAAEILWFNKIVVVVSAGNTSNGGIYPPANDPFVITVGATDDKGSTDIRDDVIASFSAYGRTVDGFAKPDLVAPGTNIISTLSNNSQLLAEHPDYQQQNYYFHMSGTSMAAPMVAGAVALLLQDEPGLTPDQVKYRLMTTARPLLSMTGTGAGSLDAYAAVNGTTMASANSGVLESKLLTADGTQQTWNSASWGSASWGSASWGSASWGSASWGSTYWGN